MILPKDLNMVEAIAMVQTTKSEMARTSEKAACLGSRRWTRWKLLCREQRLETKLEAACFVLSRDAAQRWSEG